MGVEKSEIDKLSRVTSALCYPPFLSSVQFSHSVVSDSLRPYESQHARPPCPSPTPGVHSDSHPSSQWCHSAMLSSVIPFSSCPQSLPASESFPMSQLFAWGDQSTGVSALASFLPKRSQNWSPSEWTGWISLQSKGLSRVFSNTTVQKHQFFGAQLSSQPTPFLKHSLHTHSDLLSHICCKRGDIVKYIIPNLTLLGTGYNLKIEFNLQIYTSDLFFFLIDVNENIRLKLAQLILCYNSQFLTLLFFWSTEILSHMKILHCVNYTFWWQE